MSGYYNQHDPYHSSQQQPPLNQSYHYDHYDHPVQQPYPGLQQDRYESYSEYPNPTAYYSQPSPHDQYPPPTEPYDHHYNQTYPPDQYYPDHAHPTPPDGYYPDYDPAGYPPDEKHPNGLFAPSTASGSARGLHSSPAHEFEAPSQHSSTAFAAPTRGSVAAQMVAEGAIPEKAGLRMWRSDEHSGAFMRGGKSKSCGRCCCCTMVVIALLLVGIIAGFLLWVRPPNATFNGIAPPTAGNQVDLQPGGFLLNFDLNIGVTNPNFFGASFSKISAKAFYPLNKTASIGGGELDNVDIKPHSNTTINFPFQINYTTSLDPNKAILADIASKCGFLGSAKSPIKISFDITLRLKVLAITISPTFSSSNSFTCPLKQSDFTSVLGGSQSLDALSSILTGSGGGGGSSSGTSAAQGARGTKRLGRRSSALDDALLVERLLARIITAPLEHVQPTGLASLAIQVPGQSASDWLIWSQKSDYRWPSWTQLRIAGQDCILKTIGQAKQMMMVFIRR